MVCVRRYSIHCGRIYTDARSLMCFAGRLARLFFLIAKFCLFFFADSLQNRAKSAERCRVCPFMKISTLKRALAAALILCGVGAVVVFLWPRKPVSSESNEVEEPASRPAVASGNILASVEAPIAPKANSVPSPGEQIANETRRAVEDAAAWREKLRAGEYTSLPPEAYPQGIAPPQGRAP
jgi:hypothetical protein